MEEQQTEPTRGIRDLGHLALKIRKNSTIRTAIQIAWIAAIVVFIALYLQRNWQQFQSFSWTFTVGWMVVALGWALLRKLSGGIRWVLIALYDVSKPSFRQVVDQLRVYFLSGLANYIPGSLWYMMSRVQMGRKTGISTVRTSVGVIYEMALLVLSGLLVGAYAAAIKFPEYATIIIILGVVLLAGYVVLILPGVVNGMLQLVLKFLNRPIVSAGISMRWGWNQLLIAVILWITGGLALCFVIRAFMPSLSNTNLFYIISSSALAWAIGFLAPWAPAGLGVRDGILVWLLERCVPTPIAVVATVAIRLTTVFEDLFWSGLTMLFFRKKGDI